MRYYELMFVLKPTLAEEEVVSRVDFVKEILSKNEASIECEINMGMRKLAYEVKKYERGTYTVFYFKAPAVAIKEIERILRITEEVIKFMTVKYESKKEITHWEKLVKTAKEKSSKKAEAEAEVAQ